MKKLLVLTTLALVLSMGAVSCSSEKDAGESTGTTVETTAGDSSTTAAEETTTEAAKKPDGAAFFTREQAGDRVKGWSFDFFNLNGEAYGGFEKGSYEAKFKELDNVAEVRFDKQHDTVSFVGWIGCDQEVDQFGYAIDVRKSGSNIVYGDFKTETADDIKTAGGDKAACFDITVPLTDMEMDTYRISCYAKLTDGTIIQMYELNLTFTDNPLKFTSVKVSEGGPIMFSATGKEGDWVGLFAKDDPTTYIMMANISDLVAGEESDMREIGIVNPAKEEESKLKGGEYILAILPAGKTDVKDAISSQEFKIVSASIMPTAVYSPVDMVTNGYMPFDIADMVNVNDQYVHIVRMEPGVDYGDKEGSAGNDPNFYLPAECAVGRYAGIVYRTYDAIGADMQIFIGSTLPLPQDDTSMVQMPLTADGEWHLLIMDLGPCIDTGLFDGEYASHIRFDVLESGYVLDENGEPQKDELNHWIRNPLPEGCTIDVAGVVFDNSEKIIQDFFAEDMKELDKLPPFSAPEA